jgi:hypothetical protein
MPASVETSIAAVAQYLAQQEHDPFLRVKALHDYVADRIAYDAPAFFGQAPRPPQDAETVFVLVKPYVQGMPNCSKPGAGDRGRDRVCRGRFP